MTQQIKKWKIDFEIVDFDVCSLYPSVMNRLQIPCGIPEKITSEFYDYEMLSSITMAEHQLIVDDVSYISCYIVKIFVIKKNNIEQDFPSLYIHGKGSIEYTNKEGFEMFVSNIYLEYLIKYHNIEFKIIEGIWWKGNKSNRLATTIKDIYDKRVELKRQKNKAENVYKWMMNSCYGKTIQKSLIKTSKS